MRVKKIWEGYLNWVVFSISGGYLGHKFAQGKVTEPKKSK